jgi:uncharacterized phage protein (TIGR01671 family)
MREIIFEFVFQHVDSKEIKTKRFTLDEIANGFEDDLFILECDCEPVGETNVVECNCEDYLEDFRLIDKRQFTGLLDKNGKEIYEGDIVRAYGNIVEIKYFVQQSGPYYAGYNMLTAIGTTHDVEIIGNVFENPELLK